MCGRKNKVCFRYCFNHLFQQISDGLVFVWDHYPLMHTIWSSPDLIFTSVQQTQISDCEIQTIAAGSLNLARAIMLYYNSFFLTFAGNRWLHEPRTLWSAWSVTLFHKERQWLALLAYHSVTSRFCSNVETIFICHIPFFDIWEQSKLWISSGDISLVRQQKDSLISNVIPVPNHFSNLSNPTYVTNCNIWTMKFHIFFLCSLLSFQTSQAIVQRIVTKYNWKTILELNSRYQKQKLMMKFKCKILIMGNEVFEMHARVGHRGDAHLLLPSRH